VEGATWGPSYSLTVIGADGRRLPDPLGVRTHNPAKSLKAGVARWVTSNVNNDHGTDGREDYRLELAQTTTLTTTTAVDSLRLAGYVWQVRVPGDGRYFSVEVENAAGVFALASVGMEVAGPQRGSNRRPA
jgi:hypothetical protein